MLFEMHTHSSRYSGCSSIDPVSLVTQVKKKELQGIIITEHHYLWQADEINDLRRQAELAEDFLILAGQEVETDIGHILVYGADRTVHYPTELKDLRRMLPAAALVWAHPFRNGNDPTKDELLNPLLDGIEIFSMNQTMSENYTGLKAWHEYKFTAVAGSDTHTDGTSGIYPTQFDHPIKGIGEVAAEIKKSRCRPFFKEIPKSGTNIIVTEITIGTKGDDESRNRIILKNISDEKKWRSANESLKITDSLYKNGFTNGVFRVPKIIGIDDVRRCIIEEGQRGKNLYELILHVNPKVGIDYFRMAAEWLAKLHNTGLKITTPLMTFARERKRFDSYNKALLSTGNPNTEIVQSLVEFVRTKEEELFEKDKDLFIQNHGDYHPKNIIIGQDRMQDISTMFISVIDFDSSMVFSRAFDVGYFLSQFQNQFNDYPAVLSTYKESYFLECYLENPSNIRDSFIREVNLFKLRANLSIAAYLIKVGKGQARDMDALIKRSLALRDEI